MRLVLWEQEELDPEEDFNILCVNILPITVDKKYSKNSSSPLAKKYRNTFLGKFVIPGMRMKSSAHSESTIDFIAFIISKSSVNDLASEQTLYWTQQKPCSRRMHTEYLKKESRVTISRKLSMVLAVSLNRDLELKLALVS